MRANIWEVMKMSLVMDMAFFLVKCLPFTLHLLSIVEGNPPGPTLQLSPFGCPGSSSLTDDGIYPWLDVSQVVSIGSRTLTNPESGGSHLDPIGGEGSGVGIRGDRSPTKLLIDLRSNLTMQIIEVVSGTGFVGEPAMNGHVLLTHITHQGLVTLPQELLDVVSLADVYQEIDEGLISRISNLVGSGGLTGYFDGDGSIVVGRPRDTIYPNGVSHPVSPPRTPGAVFLLHTEADASIISYYVVAGGLLARGLEYLTSKLGRNLSHKAVDGYSINDMVAGGGSVGGDEGISC